MAITTKSSTSVKPRRQPMSKNAHNHTEPPQKRTDKTYRTLFAKHRPDVPNCFCAGTCQNTGRPMNLIYFIRWNSRDCNIRVRHRSRLSRWTALGVFVHGQLQTKRLGRKGTGTFSAFMTSLDKSRNWTKMSSPGGRSTVTVVVLEIRPKERAGGPCRFKIWLRRAEKSHVFANGLPSPSSLGT